MITHAKNSIHKPTHKLNINAKLTLHLDFEPTTETQALKDPKGVGPCLRSMMLLCGMRHRSLFPYKLNLNSKLTPYILLFLFNEVWQTLCELVTISMTKANLRTNC